MLRDVLRKALHGRIFFGNFLHIQTLSNLNRFRCLDKLVHRTAHLFISMYFLLPVTPMFSLNQDKMWSASVIQHRSTLLPINCLCFERIMQPLAAENVLAQASTTRFTDFVNFCTMPFIRAMFSCFRRIKRLNLYLVLFIWCTDSSFRSAGKSHIRFVHPRCGFLTSPSVS